MRKDVYRHLLKSYGDLPLLWIGFATETFRTLMQRVVVILVVSWIVADVTAGDIDAARQHIWLFMAVYIAGVIVGETGDLLAIRTTDKRYKALLMRYYRKLVGKDLSFYRDHQAGYLASSFRQHLDGTIALVRLWRSDIVPTLVGLTLPVAVLFAAEWRAGLTAAAVVIAQATYILWASNIGNKYRKPAQEVYRKLTGEVSDEVTNAVAFKSSGKESEEGGKVAALAEQEAKLFWLRHSMSARFGMPRVLITGIGIGLASFVALSGASASPESVGLFVLLFTYMFQLMRGIGDLPDLVARHDEHVARVHPTLEYLGDSYESVKDPEKPQGLRVAKGAIEIKGVSFSYKGKGGGYQVFKDLNISVRGGERVGIVGQSGAGKSTLAGLLMRFDDVDAGSITIDGIDIRSVAQGELRQKIAYVPQEPLLFHRSIRENIAYFKRDAAEGEVVRAAKAAHAHEFISQFEAGYDTVVGERGVKLSGGQKQRVVIARAVLKGAPIMVFDEATSALDSESEEIIQAALPGIIGEHTAIVIAHRLSTVAAMDRILVMHEGKIVEEGSPAELLARKGKYYSLWQRQFERKQAVRT